jgi:calcium/calmodulin-dependent protein kinase I
VHQVRNEIAVLKRVSMGHRNILTLVDYFETMNNRTVRQRQRTGAS